MEPRRLSLGANRPVVGNQPASRSSATTHKNTNDRNRASGAPDPMGTTSKARQSISPVRKSRNKKRDLTSQLQHPRVTTSAAQFPRSLWSQPPAVQPYRSAVKMPTPVLTSLPVPEAMELATQMLPAPQSSPRRSASLPTLPLPPSFSYPDSIFEPAAYRNTPSKSPTRSPSSTSPQPPSPRHVSKRQYRALKRKPALAFRKLNNSKISKQQQVGHAIAQRRKQFAQQDAARDFRQDINDTIAAMGNTHLDQQPEDPGQKQKVPERTQNCLYTPPEAKTKNKDLVAAGQRSGHEQTNTHNYSYKPRASKTLAMEYIERNKYRRIAEGALAAARPVEELIEGFSGMDFNESDVAKEIGAHLKGRSNARKKWGYRGVRERHDRESPKSRLIKLAEELGLEGPAQGTANRWAILEDMVEKAEREKESKGEMEID